MEVGTLLARALDPAAEEPNDATRRRILDGALDVAAASGIKNLTLEAVARRAGVGRVTVYRRFGDRRGLIDALSVREAKRCLALLDEATTPEQPIADQIAEGFLAGLRMLREHPLLSRLVNHERDVLLEALTNRRTPIFAIARAYVADRLAAAKGSGARSDLDLDQVAEVFLRVTASFALIPESVLPLGDDEGAREVARRLLVPIVSA